MIISGLIISAEFGSEWPLPSRIFRPTSHQTSARPYLCTIFQVTMMDVPEPSLVINQRVRRRACLSCTSAKVKCTSASWTQNHAEDVKDWAKHASMQSLLLRQESIAKKPRECHNIICCLHGLVGSEIYESALERRAHTSHLSA